MGNEFRQRVKGGDWHVVVPVYNEAEHLDQVLETLLPLNYSDRLTFVNDASTDSSAEILDSWCPKLGCSVLHLSRNAKKEGAIREILERMEAGRCLPEYTIVLDADSFMAPTDSKSVGLLVEEAIAHMKAEDISGMAFRINAHIPRGISLLQKCIYADYSGVQFDNWLTSKFHQLWVINGPGGIFKTDHLLDSLRTMVPDFETGDLMITVRLMESGKKVGFWPHIDVNTWVPHTYNEYFKQRRRWERGTIKVLWAERDFYCRVFRERRILSAYTVLYLVYPLGFMTLPVILFVIDSPLSFLLEALAWNYPFWVSVTAGKCLWNKWLKRDKMRLNAVIWSCLNGILFLVATGPARVFGFCDALRQIMGGRSMIAKRQRQSVQERI